MMNNETKQTLTEMDDVETAERKLMSTPDTDQFGAAVAVGVTTLVVVVLLIAAVVSGIASNADQSCEERCNLLGAASSVSSAGCYCIDDHGKPWLWSEWPGIPAPEDSSAGWGLRGLP